MALRREIELDLATGSDLPTAYRSAGVSDATDYNWRKSMAAWASLIAEAVENNSRYRWTVKRVCMLASSKKYGITSE